ncbi:hypothetical protein ACJZTR_02385 [Neorickettsia risticii]|uniref:Uncharacterized protein n=1 Tax=Neorickettsia risticii (strain Illinois) TaxID=434131 RepID=C6V558_NEORI|nr:hypothetical protein [Neorickettsia risticii]ACT69523.1 conserved hypothetical protein [Neorickettsia risticii str. Illinois]
MSEEVGFEEDYSIRQAFRNKLQEMYYNAVVLGDQDMLIDSNDQVILFESKLIMRKYFWNRRTQTFEKIPTGVMRGVRRSKGDSQQEECDSEEIHQKEEELVQ